MLEQFILPPCRKNEFLFELHGNLKASEGFGSRADTFKVTQCFFFFARQKALSEHIPTK
jgi:hypothetical protein